MTKLKYNALPEVGTQNSVAEPRVGTCFKEIEAFLNGKELDGAENIKAEGIKESNLEKALQEKLTTKIGLTVEKRNESFVAEGEKFYAEEKNGATVTTPAAVISKMFGVYCYAASCKIKAATGVFFGDFITTNPTELTLTEKQHVILQCDGTNWGIIAGDPKKTAGYTAKELRVLTTEYEPSATRPSSVMLHLLGTGVAGLAQVEIVGGPLFQPSMPAVAGFQTILNFEVLAGQKFKVEGASVKEYFAAWFLR